MIKIFSWLSGYTWHLTSHKCLPVDVHYNQCDHYINDLSYAILNDDNDRQIASWSENNTEIQHLQTWFKSWFGIAVQTHVFEKVIIFFFLNVIF